MAVNIPAPTAVPWDPRRQLPEGDHDGVDATVSAYNTLNTVLTAILPQFFADLFGLL